MKWDPCPRRLAELAFRIAEHGTASVEAEIVPVAAAAVRRGVAHGAVAALLDPTSTEVVRQRAFGLIAASLAAHEPASEVDELEGAGSAVEEPLDPLGDLGEDVPVALGAAR